jgi:hypothetical protein
MPPFFRTEASSHRPPLRASASDRESDAGFESRLTLPVSWEELDSAPSDRRHEEVDRSNAGVIGFLLQEIDLRATPRAGDEHLEAALAPIRTKLDMVADLLTRFAYRDVVLPGSSDIGLSDHRIAWCAPQPPAVGRWVQIRIFFHPTFREPVVLFARTETTSELDKDASCRIEATLAPLPEPVRDGLARLAVLTQRQQQSRPLAATMKRAGW